MYHIDLEQAPAKLPHIHTQIFPCNFIKVVPLMAWGANFNFSIWHVELRGVSDAQVVTPALQEYTRVCMKVNIVLYSFAVVQRSGGHSIVLETLSTA